LLPENRFYSPVEAEAIALDGGIYYCNDAELDGGYITAMMQ